MNPYIGCPQCGEKIVSVTPNTIRRAKSPKHLLDMLVKRKKLTHAGLCKCGAKVYEPGVGFISMKVPRAKLPLNESAS